MKIKNRKNMAVSILALFVLAFAITSVSAQAFYGGQQYYQPSPLSYYSAEQISTYWPSFGKEECLARQDFIVNILPGSCSPQVIRSDLLEEQDVPVFCQLTGIKINPLIEVPEIKNIAFKGETRPKEIGGIGFHPANAALSTWGTKLVGSPIINNLGYLVVVIRRQQAENATPDWVETNLTAIITYDAEKAFGIGRAGFVLPVLTEDEWQQNYEQYSFWNGKAYIRNLEIGEDSVGKYARLAIYLDANQQFSSFILHSGQASEEIYLPGYYCAAGLKVNLRDIVYPATKVKLQVDDDELWLTEGQNFLDESCSVKKIVPNIIGGGSISITCKDVKSFTLKLDPAKAKLKIRNGEEIEGTFEVGERVVSKENIYLAYVGDTSKAASISLKEQSKQFAVLINPIKTPEESFDDAFFENFAAIVKSMVEGPGKYNWVKMWKNVGKWISDIWGETKSFEPVLDKVNSLTTGETSVQKRLEELFGKKFFILVLPQGAASQSGSEWQGYHFYLDEMGGATETNYEEISKLGNLLENYYKKANSAYEDVAGSYGNEKQYEREGIDTGEYLGAQALHQAAELAAKLKKFKTQKDLLTELVEKYPKSDLAEKAREELKKLETGSIDDASAFVFTSGETHFISLKDLKEPGKEEKSVTLTVEGETADYEEGAIITTKEQEKRGETGKIVVNRILEGYIEFNYERGEKTDTIKVKEGEARPFILSEDEGVEILVNKIHLTKEASVTLTPLVARAETQANFTFKIGIEKRAIKLSPEKTKELIEDLDESIIQWEKTVQNLGNLVKSWKATCFAGSAYLIINNFFANLGGKGAARKEVMGKVWENECADKVGLEKKYTTMHACYMDNNAKIEADINEWHGIKQDADKQVEAIKKTEGVVTPSKGLLSKDFVNDEKFLDASKKYIVALPNVTLTDKDGNAVNSKDIVGGVDSLRKNGYFFKEDVDDLITDVNVVKACEGSDKGGFSDVFCKEYKEQVFSKFSAYEEVINTLPALDIEEWKKNNPNFAVPSRIESLLPEEKKTARVSALQSDKDILQGGKVLVQKGENYEFKELGGKTYLIVWSVDSSGKGFIKRAYETSNNNISTEEISIDELKENLSETTRTALENTKFEIVSIKCINKMQDSEKVVKYFENAPYKGMPAVLPIDLQEGWYAAVPPYNTIGTATQELNAYDESALLKRFYICNVGRNGRMEFVNSPRGDDGCCIQYFSEVGLQGATLPGKTEAETSVLVRKAASAIMSAAQQYGQERVTIPGGTESLKADVQSLVPAAECEDFMSAADCSTLFNLCDPVLCPASRCNYGGRYYVSDVVKSGVIGSIMLCLPNFGWPSEGGVMVPICLSGVHAGLDNFVMIQKAFRDCLQESLNTGRNVGICDEIKSIYLCEFFWKQAVPLMKYGVPWIMEKTVGGIAGGGEYLLDFQNAFSQAQQSVDYFTNYYGVNAFEAFQARATSEAGSEVCQAWVSSRYPDSGDMLDKLLEPESPVQFYAHFSENVLTTATVPATSHYKVYFRIYSGKDQGVYYQVYLKRQPSIQIRDLPQIMQVPNAVGYISRGEQVDRAIDFTAPQGYTELCVRINGQEKCGFGQVTTSFAIDELKNQYLSEQAAAGVTTEEECISGKPSATPLLLSLNIQSGAEEALQPTIYKRGISRICASEDPGISTEAGRWKSIGFCDDAKKVKCWLDMNSVNATISDLGMLQDVHEEAKKRSGEIDAEKPLGEQEVKEKLSKAKKEAATVIGKLKDIELKGKKPNDIDVEVMEVIQPALYSLQEIIEKGVYNNYKAQAQLMIAEIYDKVVELIYGEIKEEIEKKQKGDGKESEKEVGVEELSEEEKILRAKTCKLNKASWEYEGSKPLGTVSEGQEIKLIIKGENCNGLKVDFSIYSARSLNKKLFGDGNYHALDFSDAQEKIISSYFIDDKAEVTWDAEWEAGDPQYYFIAIIPEYEELTLLRQKRIKSGIIRVVEDTTKSVQEETIDLDQVEIKTGVILFENKEKTLIIDNEEYEVFLESKSIFSEFPPSRLQEYVIINDKKLIFVEMGGVRKVDIDNDGFNEISVTLEDINIRTETTKWRFERIRCEECGAGAFNRCDRDECHDLGDCYIEVRTNFIYRCISCSEETSCSDFDSADECAENKCGLDCGWTDFGCKPNDEVKKKQVSESELGYVRNNIKDIISNPSEVVLRIIWDYRNNDISKEEAITELKKEGINEDNAEQALETMLMGTIPVGSKKKKIAVDAGHGGSSSPGAVAELDGLEYIEKHINLDVARRLKKALEDKGYEVEMTRETDKYILLNTRANIANDFGADLFVSIHMNSFTLNEEDQCDSDTAKGAETFYYRSSEEGKKLSEEIQKEIIALGYFNNRGIKDDTESKDEALTVLKATEMPAVLVEPGFMCYKPDLEIITTPIRQIEIAEAIAKGIDNYLKNA